MKKITIALLFIPIFSIYSQTITVDTFLAPSPTTTLTLIGSDGGTPARNIYGATFPIYIGSGLGEIRVQWNNTTMSWDMLIDYCSSAGLVPCTKIFNFPSSPNPPDRFTGIWNDQCGCGWPSIFTGTGTQTTLLSTNNIEISQIEVKISPNPIDNEITVYSTKEFENNFEYKIVDLTGRIVKSGNSKFNQKINVESLTNGNYIFEIENENGVKFNEKIIKN